MSVTAVATAPMPSRLFMVAILGRSALFTILGLSTKLEALRETATSSTAAGREASTTTTKALPATELTTAVHHAEEDFGINAAHATAHATTAREHVGRINQVLATVIASPLSVTLLVRD